MGWTYGVMGETQITASRARGGGGGEFGDSVFGPVVHVIRRFSYKK